jgi:hypothetical protein
MKKTILFLLAILTYIVSYSQDYSNEYEVKFIKSENGKVYFTIFNYCKKEKGCYETLKMDAVKVVLFRGFDTENKIYPIVKDYNLQQSNKSYFDNFFKKNGQYLNYIEYSEDDIQEVIDIYKRKKKAALNICVLRDNLEKEMQNQKIIKMLDNGF